LLRRCWEMAERKMFKKYAQSFRHPAGAAMGMLLRMSIRAPSAGRADGQQILHGEHKTQREVSHRRCVGRCWNRSPAHVLRPRSPAVTVTSKPRPVLGVALNAISAASTTHLDPISVVSRLAGAALITDTCTDHEGLCDSSTQKEAKLRLRGC
jgi:hypothetical protein